jgi:hypothetical protein
VRETDTSSVRAAGETDDGSVREPDTTEEVDSSAFDTQRSEDCEAERMKAEATKILEVLCSESPFTCAAAETEPDTALENEVPCSESPFTRAAAETEPDTALENEASAVQEPEIDGDVSDTATVPEEETEIAPEPSKTVDDAAACETEKLESFLAECEPTMEASLDECGPAPEHGRGWGGRCAIM